MAGFMEYPVFLIFLSACSHRATNRGDDDRDKKKKANLC